MTREMILGREIEGQRKKRTGERKIFEEWLKARP